MVVVPDLICTVPVPPLAKPQNTERTFSCLPATPLTVTLPVPLAVPPMSSRSHLPLLNTAQITDPIVPVSRARATITPVVR